MKEEILDLAIVGGGPAGLTASIFASRYGLKNMVFTDVIGGMAAEAFRVENFPSQPSISGLELTLKMKEQAEKLGGKVVLEKVQKIQPEKDLFKIFTENSSYFSKTVILATGSTKRKLQIKGEKEFLGKGVAYCATCDAPFFKDKEVAVVGGGNSAATAAILLSNYAKKIYIINIGKEMIAERKWLEEIEKNPSIEIINENTVIEIKGEKTVEEIVLEKPYKNSQNLKVQGVFIEIGTVPLNFLAENLGVQLTPEGFVAVKENLATNIEGVFAAGDITNASANLRQIITACAEGAIAATSAYNYLKSKK